MSLRAAALALWRRSTLDILEEIASGEKHTCSPTRSASGTIVTSGDGRAPRKGIVLLGSEETNIFTGSGLIEVIILNADFAK